ncbi:MAG: hypothetical protein WCW40_05895 [Bacteroidota bacterium]
MPKIVLLCALLFLFTLTQAENPGPIANTDAVILSGNAHFTVLIS